VQQLQKQDIKKGASKDVLIVNSGDYCTVNWVYVALSRICMLLDWKFKCGFPVILTSHSLTLLFESRMLEEERLFLQARTSNTNNAG
jgi:hypothetical protein